MFTRGLAVAVLGVLVAPALAQPYQGGRSAAQPEVQDRLVNSYGQALVDYAGCLRYAGNARRCGAPPESAQVLHQRHLLQQDVRVTDYYCVETETFVPVNLGPTQCRRARAISRSSRLADSARRSPMRPSATFWMHRPGRSTHSASASSPALRERTAVLPHKLRRSPPRSVPVNERGSVRNPGLPLSGELVCLPDLRARHLRGHGLKTTLPARRRPSGIESWNRAAAILSHLCVST